MIIAIQPRYLIVSEKCVKYRCQWKDHYYIVDDGFNKIEISKEDYEKLDCPIRTPLRESEGK